MHIARRLGIRIVALAIAVAGVSACDYYLTSAHGSSYRAYPSYYYASTYQPRDESPTARGGGPASSASPAP